MEDSRGLDQEILAWTPKQPETNDGGSKLAIEILYTPQNLRGSNLGEDAVYEEVADHVYFPGTIPTTEEEILPNQKNDMQTLQ